MKARVNSWLLVFVSLSPNPPFLTYTTQVPLETSRFSWRALSTAMATNRTLIMPRGAYSLTVDALNMDWHTNVVAVFEGTTNVVWQPVTNVMPVVNLRVDEKAR